jgi:hypothetical protein
VGVGSTEFSLLRVLNCEFTLLLDLSSAGHHGRLRLSAIDPCLGPLVGTRNVVKAGPALGV